MGAMSGPPSSIRRTARDSRSGRSSPTEGGRCSGPGRGAATRPRRPRRRWPATPSASGRTGRWRSPSRAWRRPAPTGANPMLPCSFARPCHRPQVDSRVVVTRTTAVATGVPKTGSALRRELARRPWAWSGQALIAPTTRATTNWSATCHRAHPGSPRRRGGTGPQNSHFKRPSTQEAEHALVEDTGGAERELDPDRQAEVAGQEDLETGSRGQLWTEIVGAADRLDERQLGERYQPADGIADGHDRLERLDVTERAVQSPLVAQVAQNVEGSELGPRGHEGPQGCRAAEAASGVAGRQRELEPEIDLGRPA